jgi:hypothetical protein
MSVAAATIVAKSNLALARVIAESFREHHPEIPFFVLLTDEVDGFFDAEAEPFEVIPLRHLLRDRWQRICFRYPQQPLSYACTPMLLEHLLDTGFDRVLFFKQESLVLGRMDDAIERLGRCSVLVTPHLLAPLQGDDAVRRELTILLSGVTNIGFLGVRDTPSTRSLLSWWSERTSYHCDHDVGGGVHYEQRWFDLVPCYFDGVEQLRDPGYNVAHWNLPERRVEIQGSRIAVDGRPCRLFRFSGYDFDRPERPTRYFDRPTAAEIGVAAEVFATYHSLLREAGFSESRRWPYAWDHFDNGVEIPEIVRAVYRDTEAAGTVFEAPFITGGAGTFYQWLRDAVDQGADADGQVSHLWLGVWQRRPDVRKVFPDPTGLDRDVFLEWTRVSGRTEHRLPGELCEPT